MFQEFLQVLTCLLLVLVGIAGIAAARRPALPVLRSVYWWRIPFKGRPTIFERMITAIGGALFVVLGAVLFTSIFILR